MSEFARESAKISALASRVLGILRDKGNMIVTAESCTGGMLATFLTAHAGSSDVVQGGFITYSDAMKNLCLRVPQILLDHHGAVSKEVVRAMAKGAVQLAPLPGIAIAVTGIAGPDGGSAEKPVGTVWFGLALSDKNIISEMRIFAGDRDTIRLKTTKHALTMIVKSVM